MVWADQTKGKKIRAAGQAGLWSAIGQSPVAVYRPDVQSYSGSSGDEFSSDGE